MKTHRKKRLYRHWLAVSLLTFLIPYALGIYYYGVVLDRKIRAEGDRSLRLLAAQSQLLLENHLKLVYRMAYQLAADHELAGIVAQPDAAERSPRIRARIERYLAGQARMGDTMVSSVAYNDKAQGLTLVYVSNWYQSNEYGERFAQVVRSNPAASLRDLAPSETNGLAYLIINVAPGAGLPAVGQIIFELNLGQAIGLQDLSNQYPGAGLLVSDRSGHALYRRQSVAQSPLPTKFLAFSNTDFTAGGQLPEFDLRLNLTVPQSTLMGPYLRQHFEMALLCLILITVYILIMRYEFRHQFMALNKLEQGIQGMTAHRLDTRLTEETEYAETEHLRQAFNDMADEITQLNADTYRLSALLHEARYRRLEAQIQPHFLFNVLELINMKALSAGDRDISRIVLNLAGLLRQSLAKDSRFFSDIESELSFARYYLALQQERFGDRLTYQIEYSDAALLHARVPSLVLEPLVENAVEHGIEPSHKPGHIDIRIWDEEERLMIEVKDNGVGFKPDEMPRAGGEQDGGQAVPPDSRAEPPGIGLANIRERLHLLYRRDDCCVIRSEPGQGTSVRLALPVDWGKQDADRYFSGQ